MVTIYLKYEALKNGHNLGFSLEDYNRCLMRVGDNYVSLYNVTGLDDALVAYFVATIGEDRVQDVVHKPEGGY